MARSDPQCYIRIPVDLKSFIEHEAKSNGSSQNSEIIRCIRERMNAKGAAGTAIPLRHDHAHPAKGKGDEYENA